MWADEFGCGRGGSFRHEFVLDVEWRVGDDGFGGGVECFCEFSYDAEGDVVVEVVLD